MSPEKLYASELLRWPASIANLAEKQQIAQRAVARVEDGQLIGVGSGATAYLFLHAVARRAGEQQLTLTVTCSSYEIETAALTLGLGLCELGSAEPDWGLDGADELDRDGRLLKRAGGALVRERLLWSTVKRMFLAAESSTLVQTLGREFALPVEVHRDGVSLVARELTELGATDVELRLATGKDGPVITELGNLLLDADFPELASGLHAEITAVPGVIETGLFEGYAFETI